MNIINGLNDFKERKGYTNADLSRLLGVSDSMVSQYLSGKSGMSLDNLATLLRDGMKLEEAFDNVTADAIKKRLLGDGDKHCDAMGLVVQGLKDIIFTLENGKSP